MGRSSVWSFVLVVLLALPAFARDWAHADCQDDYDTCRENCTMAFGTSFAQHGKLVSCLRACGGKANECAFKRFQAAHAKVPAPKPKPTPAAAPAPPPPAPAPATPVHLVDDASPAAPSPAPAPTRATPTPEQASSEQASTSDPALAPDTGTRPPPAAASPRPKLGSGTSAQASTTAPPPPTEQPDAGIPEWKRKDLSVWEPGALD